MPKKKNEEGPVEDSALVSAAKSIGTAAGKVASAIGVKPEHPTPKSIRRGKPVKKNKPRLPRKQKKALKKAAEKAAEKARAGS